MYHCCPYMYRRPCGFLSQEMWALKESSVSISRIRLGVKEGRMISQLSDYRWTAAGTDDTEYYSPRWRLFSSSVEAKCAIEMPSPSPNYSTSHRLPHPPLAAFRNRQRSIHLERILRCHSGRTWPYIPDCMRYCIRFCYYGARSEPVLVEIVPRGEMWYCAGS